MQPEELYFRGSMAQYWDVIYSEYRRLHASLGHVPFEITAPDLKSIDLAQYVPADTDPILIAFWDDGHKVEVLSVDAEYSRHEQAVWIMAYDQGVEQERAESALSSWREVKLALKNDEAARRKPGKKHGPHPKTMHTIERLQEIRLDAIQNDRPIPKKEFAMSEAGGISKKTWKLHGPILWTRWDDRSYY